LGNQPTVPGQQVPCVASRPPHSAAGSSRGGPP
jgi:hypothetical protein